LSSNDFINDIIQQYNMLNVFSINEFTSTMLIEVPLDKVKPTVMPGYISKRQLNNIIKKIENELHCKVLVSYQPTENKDNIQAGLLAITKAQLKNKIVSVNISFLDSKNATVYVFSKNITLEQREKIDSLICEYLHSTNINTNSIEHHTVQHPEPSLMILLRTIKVNYPIELESLRETLEKNGNYIPSKDWLNSKVDALRKRKLLTRDQAGNYRLTQSGLEQVPITKSRNSSDIERILSLAKKHL